MRAEIDNEIYTQCEYCGYISSESREVKHNKNCRINKLPIRQDLI